MNILPIKEIANCNSHNKMKKEAINAIVTRKYVDRSNHFVNTIELINSDSSRVKYVFIRDHSGLYDYLQKNDIVNKDKGSMKVLVKRDNNTVYFRLNYNCKK